MLVSTNNYYKGSAGFSSTVLCFVRLLFIVNGMQHLRSKIACNTHGLHLQWHGSLQPFDIRCFVRNLDRPQYL